MHFDNSLNGDRHCDNTLSYGISLMVDVEIFCGRERLILATITAPIHNVSIIICEYILLNVCAKYQGANVSASYSKRFTRTSLRDGPSRPCDPITNSKMS